MTQNSHCEGGGEMLLSWLLRNWLGVITALGILYGILMSTYNFIESRKSKRRKVTVKMYEGMLALPSGGLSEDVVFMEVVNPGYRTVTINPPFIKLPNKKNLITPWPTSNVNFPHDLVEGKNCAMWIKRTEVVRNLKDMGFSGKVPLLGAVTDATGRVYKSKKTWSLDLRTGKP